MRDSYPNPCDICTVPKGSCPGIDCSRWRTRYLYRQKQINAYAKRMYGTLVKKEDAFCYEHPDIVRDWLKHDPCEQCRCRSFCKGDCEVRTVWLNLNLDGARKVIQARGQDEL